MRRAVAKLARLDPTKLDLRLPSPWVCASLVVAFLGFGALIGRATRNPADALTATRPQLKLLLPRAAQAAARSTPPSAAPAPTPTGSSTGAEEEAEGSASEGQGSGHSSQGSGGSSQGSGHPKRAQARDGSEAGAKAHGGAGGEDGKLPPIKHVFVVMLADQPYASVFGPASRAPYLAKTLERRGELLVRYYAVAHDELSNAIALVSGQGPTAQTAVNCPTYAPLESVSAGADGQVLGQGCVYPASTQTLAGQLEAKHLTWKAYVEAAEPTAMATATGGCTPPALGGADPTVDQTLPPVTPAAGPGAQAPVAYEAAAGSAYATFRNPFLYFSGLIESGACAADNAGLDQLTKDLSSARGAPNLSYIAPSLCDDGSPTPCAPGRPAGLPPAEAFLRRVVPRILASKSYKHGGLLVITVDQAPASGAYADSSSCCGQPAFPALPAPPKLPGGGSLPPSGGGQVGALLLSPYVKPGTTSQETFNHFSLLRTIEGFFGLKHLGYAALPKVEAFGPSVFSDKRG